MTTPDTLRQLQAEATPGPWEALEFDRGSAVWDSRSFEVAGDVKYDANARLIAAAPTHLADLITALEQIERVRDLHKRVEIQGSDGFGGLKTIGYECDYCGEHLDTLPYPCPTIRILDGNE